MCGRLEAQTLRQDMDNTGRTRKYFNTSEITKPRFRYRGSLAVAESEQQGSSRQTPVPEDHTFRTYALKPHSAWFWHSSTHRPDNNSERERSSMSPHPRVLN